MIIRQDVFWHGAPNTTIFHSLRLNASQERPHCTCGKTFFRGGRGEDVHAHTEGSTLAPTPAPPSSPGPYSVLTVRTSM